MGAKIVSLTSDFGLSDPYVGEMKASILSICPSAAIVDLTHGVEKFNVRAGAFMLVSATPYFPPGTVHVAVVDPSVGTQRRPIIIATSQSFFVGPDNGLLFLAAEAQRIREIRHIECRRFMLTHVSRTFHGRDIFAPVAAHIANDMALEEFGPRISNIVKPEFAKFTRIQDGLAGQVLHVDGFGNIITNIPGQEVVHFKQDVIQVKVAANRPQKMKISRIYADAKIQEPIALVGSHGYLEIAINQGNAATRFSAEPGDQILLSRT